MSFPTVRVLLKPSNEGRVWIRGQEVPNVRRVRITGEAGATSAVELELVGVNIELDICDEWVNADDVSRRPFQDKVTGC